MAQSLVNEELVATSEARMLDLLHCDEVRDLEFLSVGLAGLLEQCDSVFLDTSALSTGVISFNSTYRWMDSYRNKRGEFNLDSIAKVHYAYENHLGGLINLDELYESVHESLFCGDFTLRILEEAFRCRQLMLPAQVFEEVRRFYRISRNQIDFVSGKGPRIHHAPMGAVVNRKSRSDRGAHIKSHKELLSRRKGNLDPGLVACIRANLNRFSDILSFAQLNGRVIESSGIYPYNDPVYNDHTVIDSAMTYPGKVGIVTFDRDFQSKILDVRDERSSKGLAVPLVYLLLGSQDIRRFELRWYQS